MIIPLLSNPYYLDVPLQVSVVVNYDLPRDNANYIHRIGRGGRLGRQAVAINLCGNDRDQQTLGGIEHHYAIRIPELPNNVQDLLATR